MEFVPMICQFNKNKPNNNVYLPDFSCTEHNAEKNQDRHFFFKRYRNKTCKRYHMSAISNNIYKCKPQIGLYGSDILPLF